MTEPETPPPPPRKPPPPKTGRIVLAVVLGGLAVAGTGLYLARLAIARDVLTGWLRERGVQADLSFDTFGLGGLSGAMRVGPVDKPALTVDRMEVDYRWGGFWSGDPFGLQVSSVHLVRPILHGTWTDKGLSLGSLDRVIEEFSKQPPPEHQPAVKIEDGLMVLASPYGVMEVRADAELEDGKLKNIDARSSATRLTVGEAAFALGPGGLTVRNKDGRLEALFQVYVAEAQAESLSAKAVNVRLAVQAPYPDLAAKRADGPVALRLVLSGDEMGAVQGSLADARVEARFDGKLAGPIQDLVLSGSGQVEGAAASASAAGARARALRLTFDAPEFAWSRKGGDRFTGRYEGAFKAAELTQAALRLRDPRVEMKASGVLGSGGPSLQARGSATARGAWSGLGPVLAADDPETRALKTALADFSAAAPNFAFNFEGKRLALSLPAPVTIRTRSGGAAVLAAVRGQPVFDGGTGRFALAMQGGGLPQATLAVDRFTAADGVVSAQTRLDAKGSFGPARVASLTSNGLVRVSAGGLRYSIPACAAFAAERLEFGENDIEKVAAQICPAAGPLISTEDGAVRLQANVRQAGAAVPFLQMRGQDVSGALDIRLKGGRAYGRAQVATATIEDASPQRRFYPVAVSGPVRLEADHVTANLALADRAGHALAQGVLDHDLAKGRGSMTFDTGALVFAQGGLQPAEISPLAAAIASPASGQAAFKGAIAWDAKGLTSHGDLKLESVGFKSPAGAVSGLSGAVAFDSLMPPKAAAGQKLTVQRVDALGQLTNAQVVFGLDETALYLEDLAADVGGGRIDLGKTDIPFDPKASWSGTVDLAAVQVSDLVKASPFGDKVSLDAKLSGKLPFTVTPQGVRIASGELHAVQPGTLSIQREALTGVQAKTEVGTDVPGVPSAKPAAGASENVVADFAYQALEHLAFETLAAQVDSLPQGRLGVNFQIKGAFKPPQKQELRLGYMEAIRGTYMNKQLPLPSNTKVDLSLDTTVNLDQLLADYAEYQRLRGSGPVQP